MKAIRNSVWVVFIGLLFMSCQGGKKNPKIEIFLAKNRIETTLGVPYTERNTNSDTLAFFSSVYDLNVIRKDTSYTRAGLGIIHAGPFEAVKDQLELTPFIANENIIGFNDAEAELVVDSIAKRKLDSLPNETPSGRQFVLLVNGKPKLSGYFINMEYFQGGIYTNSIRYINRFSTNSHPYILYRKGNEMTLKTEQPELYKAFKQSDRILADDKNL